MPLTNEQRILRKLRRLYLHYDEPEEWFLPPWIIADNLRIPRSQCRKTLSRMYKKGLIRKREHYRGGQRVSWYGHEGYVYGFDPRD